MKFSARVGVYRLVLSYNVLLVLLLSYSSSRYYTTTNAFGILHLPSPEIVLWTQQHVITTATLTLPKLPNVLSLYQNALHTLPLQTQMITGAILAVAGDTVAQSVSNSNQSTTDQQQQQQQHHHSIDMKRTISFAAFDACYRAVQHILYPPMKDYFHGQFLYPIISKILPSINVFDQHHNQILAAAAEQSLISQLVVIPLLYYPIFFAITGMVQGLTLEQSMIRGKQSFIPLMQRNLLFWIPVQFGVFGYINDDALQISILIACGFIWTMILSAYAGSVSVATTTSTAPKMMMMLSDQIETTNQEEQQTVDVYMSPLLESDQHDTGKIMTQPPLPKAYAAVGISSNSTGMMDMMIFSSTEENSQQLLR